MPFSFRFLAVLASLFLARLLSAGQDSAQAEKSKAAAELMASHKYEEAIPLYNDLVKSLPGNPGLLLDLGLAHAMAGHAAEAAPLFESVLKLQPGNVPALTSLAECRLELNQPKLAIAPLEKLIALEPANRDGRGMLAGALLSLNRLREAAQQYRKLTTLDGSDAKAWYGLGKTYEALAGESFASLQKIAPGSAYVLALVGDSQLSRQQYRSAFFFYREAQARTQQLPGVHASLAKLYSRTGHADWAVQESALENALPVADCAKQPLECRVRNGRFLEAVQTPPAGVEAFFWSTKAYNELALEAFEKLGHLPESVEIHALKAAIFTEHRQYLQSVTEWKAALQMAPENSRLQSELNAALFQAKDYGTLIPRLEQAMQVGRSTPETNFMLGASLLQTEHPDQALPYLETALRQDASLLVAHASLGMALARVDRTSEAIPHLEKAVELDADGSVHYQLARAYKSAGQSERSRGAMAKYQEIQKLIREQDEKLNREAQITAPLQKTP
jgi:tetratricopeptide (TPR) repeat protein